MTTVNNIVALAFEKITTHVYQITTRSHTGQSNNTLTQYSSEQDADITSKLGTNNNLSQYLYNPKSDIPMYFWAGPSKQSPPRRGAFRSVLFMKNFWAGPSKQGLLVSIFASISICILTLI
jgi:hypothetical protein